MKLFTPFTFSKKDNYDLCRIKTKKRKAVENPLLDNLFRNLYRQRFDFVFDWPKNVSPWSMAWRLGKRNSCS